MTRENLKDLRSKYADHLAIVTLIDQLNALLVEKARNNPVFNGTVLWSPARDQENKARDKQISLLTIEMTKAISETERFKHDTEFDKIQIATMARTEELNIKNFDMQVRIEKTQNLLMWVAVISVITSVASVIASSLQISVSAREARAAEAANDISKKAFQLQFPGQKVPGD